MVRALVVFGVAFAAACHGPSAPGTPDAGGGADSSPGACVTDSDCAAHEVCDDTAAPHACVCAAGYAGAPCAWVGVIANPGCSMQGGWNLQGNTRIDDTTLEVGMVDVGACDFFPASEGDLTCGGIVLRFDQTITMPRLSRAEPLVVQASYDDASMLGFGPWFGVGTAWNSVPNPLSVFPQGTGGYTSARSCLGAGEYAPESTTGPGAPLPFRMMLNAPTVCLNESEVFVDRVDIVPAAPGECAAPGTAMNADAEGSDGWTFESSGGSTAAFVDGAGANGSRGVALHLDHRCDAAVVTDKISIPVDVASPALSFYARATSGATLAISFADNPPDGNARQMIPTAPLPGTGSGDMMKLCIPAYVRGAATRLEASLTAPYVQGGCADVVGFDGAIDDVSLVDDPSCGTDPSIADGGFESNDVPFGTFRNAAVVHDASLAHSGQGVLQLGVDSACVGGEWSTLVIPPAWGAGAGPAVTYAYEAPSAAAAYLRSGLIADGLWHRGVECLDPRIPAVPQSFGVGMAAPVPTPPSCTPATAYFDDVTVTTDPSCPTM